MPQDNYLKLENCYRHRSIISSKSATPFDRTSFAQTSLIRASAV